MRLSRKTVILFDLDGTLTDSGPGIMNSARYALEKLGVRPTEEELHSFIGPPLHLSFQNTYGFSEEKSFEGVRLYREYYAEKGIFENELYPGVDRLLQKLKDSGKSLILATSKAEFYAKKVMDHFRLTGYFDFMAGSEMDGSRSDKAEVIAYALEGAGVADKASALMIGDRSHDIIGAKKNGLDSVGVLYGYGDRPELEEAGADAIAATVEELGLLLGLEA